MSDWTEHVARWKDCTACPLHEQRFRICIARGNIPCDVLFIGEAPGPSEDARGLPFHGPAGNILDQIIARAVPSEVPYALTNLVCCFPREAKERGDNEPERSEILACHSRLIEFVNIAQPRLIVCVGRLSTQYVDHNDTIPCVDIVHPAATFPGRMARIQADAALHRAVVVISNAVDKLLQSSRGPFQPWGQKVTLSLGRELKQRMDAFLNKEETDLDIPF